MLDYWIQNLPLFIIVITLIAAFMMPIFARWYRKITPFVTLLFCLVAFVSAVKLATIVLASGPISYHVAGWAPPWGIEIVIDHLAVYMLLILTGLYIPIIIFSIYALKHEIKEEAIGWYYTLTLLLLAAMMGMVITNDMFNLYVMVEVTGLAACGLVIAKGDKRASEATLKYLLLATIGSGFFLFAIGLVYMVTGNLNMTFISQELIKVRQQYPFLLWTALSFFLVGFGLKSALFPMHVWLPDAHASAPSPSSAILSGLVVKVYIVALIRVIFGIFGTDVLMGTNIHWIIMIMAVSAIVGGSLLAYVQLDLKRRLAYSTVAQIGYIYLGIGLGTPLGLTAALLHILNHALMKVCLFLGAGAIHYQTGKRRVTELNLLGYRMPVTLAAFSIASLSMIGIPLFNGFVSKFYLGYAGIDAGLPAVTILMVISGLLNAMYYLPIIWEAYFTGAAEDAALDKVPAAMWVPLALLAVGIIFLGIYSKYPLQLIDGAVTRLLAL